MTLTPPRPGDLGDCVLDWDRVARVTRVAEGGGDTRTDAEADALALRREGFALRTIVSSSSSSVWDEGLVDEALRSTGADLATTTFWRLFGELRVALSELEAFFEAATLVDLATRFSGDESDWELADDGIPRLTGFLVFSA